MIRYGIYGYEMSVANELEGFKLVPYCDDYSSVKKLASDLDNYNLTGFLEIDDDNKVTNVCSLIFDLQAVLSFVDQKSVIITNSLHDDESYTNLGGDYPQKITAYKRLNGGGQLILGDAFSRDSRRDFIAKALVRLSDKSDNSNESFRVAFFRSVEILRGSGGFIDVDYYLLFSALETLCRSYCEDYVTKNCSEPIAKVLIEYGFDVSQDNPKELHKAVSTYAHLRNALFHNGRLECEVNINDQRNVLRLTEYFSQFRRLVPLVIMKSIKFDDGHINWNSWLDRMSFK
jgi:hypothetical protein